MNAPVMVWRRGGFRIVAVDEHEHDHGDDDETITVPVHLVMERCYLDSLNTEMWLSLDGGDDEDASRAMILLMCETASRIEVLPSWVKKLVREYLGAFDEAEKDEGAA